MNINAYIENGKKRRYEKGEYIAREGDTCTTIGILIEGNVRISSLSYNGNEIVYKILAKGDMFGNNLLFSSNPIYKGDVVAEEDTIILIYNKEEFIDLLSSDKELLLSFLSYQSDDAKKLNQQIKILSMSSAEERLMYLLGHNKKGLRYKNVTSLASLLSLTREVTSRLIHKLEKDGVIEIKDKVIYKID